MPKRDMSRRPRTRSTCQSTQAPCTERRADGRAEHRPTQHRRRRRSTPTQTSPPQVDTRPLSGSSQPDSIHAATRASRRLRSGHAPGSPRVNNTTDNQSPGGAPLSPAAQHVVDENLTEVESPPVVNVLTRAMVEEWRGILQAERTLPMRPRNLFGQPSEEEMQEFWRENEQRFAQQFVQQWNFDPQNDRPLPGNFVWQRANSPLESECGSPSAIRSRC